MPYVCGNLFPIGCYALPTSMGDRPALFEGDQVWHYDRLLQHAGLVAHWRTPIPLQARSSPSIFHAALIAYYGARRDLAGRAYLPLAEGLLMPA